MAERAPKGRLGSFVSWVALRAAVNAAHLADLQEVLRERIDRWEERSYEHEAAWRRR